jgi:transposase
LVSSTAGKLDPSVLGFCPEQMMGRKSRMQGKESSEQKTKIKSSAGIDVCKSWLDVHVLPEGCSLRVANDARGHRQLKKWLTEHDVSLVAIEATGKWHRQVHRMLHASGFGVAVVNPLRARLFAEAIGLLAKTDRLDARMLALLAVSLSPPARPPAPEAVEALQELIAGRAGAVAEQTALENQLAAANTAFLRRQLRGRIDRIAKDIVSLQTEIERRIECDQALARRYAILLSIPGVGPVTAATLIAGMTELGTCSAKQIAMLSGLAPVADQSGGRDGQRAIRGGRAAVRRVLYLCALSAKRCNPGMTAIYNRLIAAGRPHKVALIAVARKLIVLANTLITQNRPWQPRPPIQA